MKREILLSGSGGQGVITASIILAEAAALHDGYHAVQSQSYGPEARGGHSSAHVIVSDTPIGYPKVQQPHAMVCLTEDALHHFMRMLRPGGLLLVDTWHVKRLPRLDAKVYRLPLHQAVMEQTGLQMAFNIAMLGALVAITSCVRAESLEKAVRARVPQRYLEQNLKALAVGRELALG